MSINHQNKLHSNTELLQISRLLEPEPHKNVLMYIRTEQDVAFDGLMLDHASLNGLKEAV